MPALPTPADLVEEAVRQAHRVRGVPGRLAELAALARRVASPAPPPPPRTSTGGTEAPEDELDRAAGESADAVEGLARGLTAARATEEVLGWAADRLEGPLGRVGAGAAASAVIRESGYDAVADWARGADGDEVIRTLGVPLGVHPDIFCVPRRVYVMGAGIRRRFERDFPYLGPVLQPPRPLGQATLFRTEAVPALAEESELMQFLGGASEDVFEEVLLPMSRIPGVNVLILAGMLLQELLDPMEALGWVGADINNLPRAGTPNRPEEIRRLPEPRPADGRAPAVKYMIFSDIHREPPQDVEYRISHFTANRELYLRALEYCDREGHTVIENGDCEELWYVPSFRPSERQTVRERLEDTVEHHRAVYDKLADLAKRGRYHRAIGNHDSYLWEDPELVDWRRENGFEPLWGGFVIAGCKPLDDFWPPLRVGLDPDSYKSLKDMLVLHGHHFDFWNCDEHNRLGKFITNAMAVPTDAFDDVLYDFRGLDRLGHPLVEFSDLLAPLTPWNNWPPADVAREWAEALEFRPLNANLTQDGITYSETFAAVMGMLMRSGDLAPGNFSPLLCLGHTHNPQSRPWIPYLERFNPWREEEIAGLRLLQDIFWIKTHYLNSGTVGWWENLVWALEITEDGQPRLLYWAAEDSEPVTMDWELKDREPLVGDHFAGIAEWLRRHVAGDIGAGLDAALEALRADGKRPAEAAEPDPGAFWGDSGPDLLNLLDLSARPLAGAGRVRPDLPLSSAAALAAVGAGGDLRDHLSLGALTLASRQHPALRGADPRDWLMRVRQAGRRGPSLPQSAALTQMIYPRLVAGAEEATQDARMGIGSLVRGLFFSYTPRAPEWIDAPVR